MHNKIKDKFEVTWILLSDGYKGDLGFCGRGARDQELFEGEKRRERRRYWVFPARTVENEGA